MKKIIMITLIFATTLATSCDKEDEWYDEPEFQVTGTLEFTKWGEQRQITIINVGGKFNRIWYDKEWLDIAFSITPQYWYSTIQTITVTNQELLSPYTLSRSGSIRFLCKYGKEDVNVPYNASLGVPYTIHNPDYGKW